MFPISKELETLDMLSNFDIDKENIPSITLSISMVIIVSITQQHVWLHDLNIVVKLPHF